MKIKKEIVSSVIRNSGGTFRACHDGLKLTRLTSGYFVSITDYPVTLDQFKPGYSIPALYEQALDAGFYLGFWIDAGQVYIDLSMFIKDRFEALAIGRAYDQKAIWDIEAEKAIDID